MSFTWYAEGALSVAVVLAVAISALRRRRSAVGEKDADNG